MSEMAWSIGAINYSIKRIFDNGPRNPGQQEVRKFGTGEAGRASDCIHYSLVLTGPSGQSENEVVGGRYQQWSLI